MGDLMVRSMWWLVEAIVLLILAFGVAGPALRRYRMAYNLDIIPRPVRFNQTFFNPDFRHTVQAALRLRAERFVSALLVMICLGMALAGQPWNPRLWWVTIVWAALVGLDAIWTGIISVRRA